MRTGAEVVHSGIDDVHATGHAKAEELKTLLSIIRPEFFVPGARRVPPPHGPRRARPHHGRRQGPRPGLPRTATSSRSTDKGLRRSGQVPAGLLYVDGIVGDVGDGVLRDRQVLADEGVVVVIVAVDVTTGAVLMGPEIITRGWMYAPEAEDLLDQCADRVRDAVKDAFQHDATTIEDLQRHVRRAAGRFVNQQTKRRPMIVPVVMEV